MMSPSPHPLPAGKDTHTYVGCCLSGKGGPSTVLLVKRPDSFGIISIRT